MNQQNPDVLDVTFSMVKKAVHILDRQQLESSISHIYHLAHPALTGAQQSALAGKLITLLQESDSIYEAHERYRQDIHVPYTLPDPMAHTRQKRAEAIAKTIAEKVKEAAHPELPILDYGAGGGEPAAEIAKLTNRQVVAADVENFLIQGLPETVTFTPICHGKILAEVKDRSIGDVLVAYALHHASGVDYDVQFRELYRVLADGGKLHILETGVADGQGNPAYADKGSFLYAQLLDFITSNFFRAEPVIMPVPGNYYDEYKWKEHAQNAGFQTSWVERTGRDEFGEDCFEMTFVK